MPDPLSTDPTTTAAAAGSAAIVRTDISPQALERLQLAYDQADALAGQSTAKNTRRAYQADWAAFRAWCDLNEVPMEPLPAPPLVAMFLASQFEAGLAQNTMKRRLSGIAAFYHAAGQPSPREHPAVLSVIKGIARSRRKAVDADGDSFSSRPLLLADLERLVPPADSDALVDRRDRAMLLLAFAGAFRRSELAGVGVDDLKFHATKGMSVRVAFSKTEQEGQGRPKPIPYTRGEHAHLCPVTAVRAWIDAAQIVSGPLFRRIHVVPYSREPFVGTRALSPQAVNMVVKNRASAAGIPVKRLAGHSARHGFVTEATERGESAEAIARVTGHKRLEQIETYRRDADPFPGAARPW
jgi:site-specific recombinase XerD